MKEIDALDIFFKAEDGIRFYWQFYVVGIVALMGWLISLEHNLTRGLKLLVSIAFLLFMAMNITGLLNSYVLINAAQNDVSNMLRSIEGSSTKDTEIINVILKMWYPKSIIWWLHGIIDSIMVLAIWSDTIWETLRKS